MFFMSLLKHFKKDLLFFMIVKWIVSKNQIKNQINQKIKSKKNLKIVKSIENQVKNQIKNQNPVPGGCRVPGPGSGIPVRSGIGALIHKSFRYFLQTDI